MAVLREKLVETTAAWESEQAANANLEGILTELWRQAYRSRRRALDLETELASLRNHLAGVERRAVALDADLARVREELGAVHGSRIWRWGEPIGRLVQSLGLMRRR